MNKKGLLLVLLMVGNMIHAFAQRQLVVVDIETLVPIANVNVVGNMGTVTTDSLGYFSISNDSALGDASKSQTLSFSHVNYESRLINLDEVGDTVFMISKLLNLKEVVVFGKGKKREYTELQKRLGLDKIDAQLIGANPSGGLNLFGLIQYLIPKKWRGSYRKEQRKKRHQELLDSY